MEKATIKPAYEDFEPFCRWRREKEQDIPEVHLKGFRKDELKVRLTNGIVAITRECLVDETRRSRFRKEIRISENCKPYEIRAKLSGGFLYVIMPKKTPPSSRKSSSNDEAPGGSESIPSNYLVGWESSSSMQDSSTKLMALQFALVLLSLVVAFGAYVYK